VGYQLVRVKFDDQHRVAGSEVFIDGWLNNGEIWGRPSDVLQLPDGSLLVSDDYNGVIYRVSYGEGNAAAKAPVAASPLSTVTDLKMPESSIAHPDGRIFVTEIGERNKGGDGKVTVINTDGSKSTLAEGLNDPKGIDMFNNQLYVADVDQVVRIDLNGNKTVIAKPSDFQSKPAFLNDIEIDGMGNVYVSDSGEDSGKHAAIYKITPQGKVIQLIGDNSGIKRPNGLLLDGVNALLVADFGTGKLFRLDFSEQDGKFKSNLTLLNQGFGSVDGLVRDPNSVLYVSDWAGGKVWKLSEPKATPQLISEGHQSSADISISADGKTILMPDMKAGTLVPISIR
jgi:sugar lactone lactonase YvrE